MEDRIIPSEVGDIHIPDKGLPNTVDTSFEFTPQNPFTVPVPPKEDKTSDDDLVGYPGFPVEPEKSGFFKTALSEFQETSTNYRLTHILSEPTKANQEAQYLYPGNINDKFYNPAPDGWSPKQEIEKQTNLDPKFIPYLLRAKTPDDFNYMLDSINTEADRENTLQNGSTLAKILGGVIGLSPIGSIEDFIPLVPLVTKAKVASGFFEGAIKNIPGIAAASAIHEGAYQIDQVQSNLSNFLKDTFIDLALGTVLFGSLGAAKTLVNISELNRLKTFSRESLDGIGFNFKVDKEGNLKGFQAVDTTSGSLSAAKVTKAQEMADAAFYKGGLFKIPYVGKSALALISGNIPGLKYFVGSPIVRVLTSKYKAANAFGNSAFDHYITTEGDVKGYTKSPTFESKVKQTRALLTSLKAQTDALHAERNGYKLTARPIISIQNAWSSIKQKGIEELSRQSKSTDWVSKNEFMDEIQHVMTTGEPSEHAAVNTAASIYRKIKTDTAKDYLKAYNLPEDYFRNMDSYVSRVYDTNYMNENEVGPNGWVPIISKYLSDSDSMIEQRMRPINQLKEQIKISEGESKVKLKNDLKYETEKLQNELRSNPDYDYHVEDIFSLSADESRELKNILKPLNKLKIKVEEQEKILSKLKKGDDRIYYEEKLNELKRQIEDENHNLYDKARTNQINPRLYNPLTFEFRDPSDRLKFREPFKSHAERELHAKSAYDSIMNMHPEDVISDIFGKITGNAQANPLKKRTLMVPDKILYDNHFMTKDLYSKTSNYVNFLSKRTHLKTSFSNVTVNGDFEELAESLKNEYESYKAPLNKIIETSKDTKEISKAKKAIKKESKEFNDIKKDMKNLFQTRMMGINKKEDFDLMARRTLMSLSAAANLHNLPATQITDVGWAGFQHGLWPFVRDGIYPIIQSLGGILKTNDSEALRKMAPHIHLGMQDVLNNYADRNWHSELQPYVNMGKFVSGVEKVAHFSALTDLSPYIDNGIQRMNGSIIQSQFMNLLHKQLEGDLSNKESLYLRKYGIDSKEWAERMVNAYKESGGFKTKLGGYMSKSWQWQDLEAAKVFNDSVFRGIQNTLIWKGIADSPFFADNIIGMFFHTFTGWAYASVNRYMIPAMQHPDAELLVKMLWMAGIGSLVSPIRRISRGEDPVPEDMTDEQRSYEAWSDSGLFSTTMNVLNMANFLSNDKLLGDLKSDKYKNRVKSGIFGVSDVVSSTISRIGDVLGMATSGLNQKDLKTAANMLPIVGAMYMHYISAKLIDNSNLPRNKRSAEIENS